MERPPWATMISEVYDAFIAAGAPEDKARRRPRRWPITTHRFDRAEREIPKVQAEQVLLRWMVGFVIALDVAILIRVFFR